MTWILLVAIAWSADHRVVREGDTVESVAAGLGDPALAGRIREINGLAAGAQPEVGRLLMLPELPGEHLDQQAALLAFRGALDITVRGRPATPEVGLSLPLGSTVCTKSDGYATVRLAVSHRGGIHDDLSLFPGTCLTVDGTSSRPGARSSLVRVDTGSVSVRSVGEAAEPGSVTVVTPSGTTSGDRGGFRVTIEPEAMRTEALYARATVFGAMKMLELQPGQGSRTPSGSAPGAPVALLAPGTPTAPEDGAVLRRPDFAWVPVDRALGYRLEVAVAPDFSDVVRLEDVQGTEWLPDRLFLPFRVPGLWWRVASIDRTGFVGVPSEARSLAVPEGLGP